MRNSLLPVVLLLAATPVLAQPGPFLHADLQYATHVCTDTTYSTDALQSGLGTVDDLDASNRGCLFGNERQGVWMHFQAATAGQVGFTIAPTQSADYDFGVWGPFMEPPWTLASAPVRCSFAGSANAGGLNYTAQDLTEAAGGDGWVRHLDVQAGEWYVLYVDHFIQNGIGFALTWQLQGGATLACLEAPVPELGAPTAPVMQGAPVDLVDESSDHPYAWYWEFPTGVPATSLERDPQGIVFSTPGCHPVQLTVYNAAGSATTTWPCAVQVELSTGVATAEPADLVVRLEAALLRVVPQPAVDVAQVHLPSTVTAPVDLMLLNGQGAVVRRSGPHAPPVITLDLQGLPGGTYLLLVHAPGAGRWTHRLVKLER